VYGACRLIEGKGGDEIEVIIKARKNSTPICSGCNTPGSCYDTQPERRYQFAPFWGIKVFFLYKLRRVDCLNCGVTIEQVPWADVWQRETITYKLFLAHWAKKLSWQDAAKEFRTTWQQVFRAVAYVVSWGLEHRELSGITAMGVDEILTNRGHHYATVVYQIDEHCRRLLWVGKKRTAATFRQFFAMLGTDRSAGIQYVCSDMWKPYLQVIAQKIPQAIHILDRFHIVANLNKALDKVRAQESRALVKDGYEPVLKGSRWCFLKRPENLTVNQQYTLKELLKYNLKSVRAYLLKEDFQQFWKYESPVWAEKFLDAWCVRVMRSKIEPLKKQAQSIRSHKQLILNWFRAKKLFSSGIVEGFNCKAKLTMRKAYGFRSFEALEIALYHQLGDLPTPQITHSLW
jgi:transposase